MNYTFWVALAALGWCRLLLAAPQLSDLLAEAGTRHIVIVGLTGGLEKACSQASGVVQVHAELEESLGRGKQVDLLVFNNFRWRRASRQAIEAARRHDPPAAILVYGHSLGASAIGSFARALDREGMEILLAVYVDAVGLRNPRVPENVRFAINYYQRSGILRGLPLRGKSRIIAENPQTTRILGNHRIRPETPQLGRSWNPFLNLFYRHHHRIAYDARISGLVGVVAAAVAGRPGEFLETEASRVARHAEPDNAGGELKLSELLDGDDGDVTFRGGVQPLEPSAIRPM